MTTGRINQIAFDRSTRGDRPKRPAHEAGRANAKIPTEAGTHRRVDRPAVQTTDRASQRRAGEGRWRPTTSTLRRPTNHFSTCGPTANRDCGDSARPTIEYRIKILLSTTLAHDHSDMLRTLFASTEQGILPGRHGRIASTHGQQYHRTPSDMWNVDRHPRSAAGFTFRGRTRRAAHASHPLRIPDSLEW